MAGKAQQGTVTIRSFRGVFDLERRIYRIDRLTLNPAGVPVRGVVYAAIAFLSCLILSRLPLVGWPLALLPWWVRLGFLPVGGASLLAAVRIEGRVFHHF